MTVSPKLRVPLCVGVLLLVVGLFCWPMWLGEIVYQRDLLRWVIPARSFVRSALEHGTLPLWNPLQGLGFPVAADPLYGLFYPPNLLLLLGPLARMVTWLCALHVLFGGVGVLLLARRFGATPAAQLVASVAWSLAGFTCAEWTLGLLLLASSFIPWCALGFIALGRTVQSGGTHWLRGVAMAAAPVALAILLGEVFIAIVAVGFGLAVTAACLGLPRRRLRRFLGATILALILATGIGAAAVIPALSSVTATERAHPLPLELAQKWSLPPLRLAELGVAVTEGQLYLAHPNTVGRLFGIAPFAFSVYLGASVLALALLALGRGRRSALGLLGIAIFGVLLSLGRFTPLERMVRLLVPPLALMREPEKYLVITVGAVALLAGLGATRLFSSEPICWGRTAILGALFLGGAGAAGWLPAELAAPVRAGALHSAAAVGAILALQWLASRRPRLTQGLLLGVVLLDLGLVTSSLLVFAPVEVATLEPPLARAIRADFARQGKAPYPPRLYRSAQVDRSAVRSGGVAGELPAVTLRPNSGGLFGVANVPGYDAAMPRALTELLYRERSVRTLRLLGIDYALLSSHAATTEGLEPMLDPIPGARLYRVRDPLPRVYVAGAASVEPDEQAYQALLSPEVVAGGRVLLSPASGVPALVGPIGRAGSCTIDLFRPDRIEATCTATRPGVAVFIEEYDRGWSATVDGAAAPLARANLVGRALALAAGTHRVVLRYRAPGLAAGIAISLLALALVAGLWVAGGRRRREPGA